MAVEIDLVEAAHGAQVEVSYEAIDRCEHCHGNGAEPGTPIKTCERCGGAGQLQAATRTPFGQMVRTIPCDVCHGDGRVPEQPCRECRGRGRRVAKREIDVEIPAGIAAGQRLRRTLDERADYRAARNRFDADRSRTGAQIQKSSGADAAKQNSEHHFTNAASCRAHFG